jgi:D-3-phosphoglycerate dehydrogenase / 2-oxoglutarate reductase
MRILIVDKFEPSGIDGLKALGCEVLYQTDLKDESSIAASVKQNQPDVLVVRSTKVTASILEAGGIKLVVRAGAGYNTIDVATASKRGIYVSNCPGKNSIAVAELAFALILALDRRIADNVISLRRGEWNKKEFSKARGLYGRNLGLIGLGKIGQEMICRAHAFGMNVLAWSRSLTPEKAEALGIKYIENPNTIARESDIVSVHVALDKSTRGFLGNDFFSSMRKGAYFINTSRGEVVDEPSLIRAIQEKGIRTGLDVYANEPSTATGEFKTPITQELNVYGTHHIGASTDQAQEAIATETVRIVQVFKTTGKVPNVVNLARQSAATHMLVVRHRDRPGVLATVLEAVKSAEINVQEMENIIFEGAEAAVARINLGKAPSSDVLATIQKKNPDIIELNLIDLRK